jgi:hypothetical protein
MFRGLREGAWGEDESVSILRVLREAGMDEGLLRATRRKKRLQGHNGRGRFVIAEYDAAKLEQVWAKGKETLKKVGVGVEKWLPWAEREASRQRAPDQASTKGWSTVNSRGRGGPRTPPARASQARYIPARYAYGANVQFAYPVPAQQGQVPAYGGMNVGPGRVWNWNGQGRNPRL